MFQWLSRSIAIRVSAFILLMVLLCAVAVGTSSILLYRSAEVQANAQRALDIAQSAASLVDPAKFTEIMRTLEKDDHWYAAKNALDYIAAHTDITYLYVLNGEYDENMTYFAEGYNPDNGEEEIDLGDQESLTINGEPIYAAEMFETLKDAIPRMTGIYDAGDYGKMVAGFAPITNASGKAIGVVGVDLNVDTVLASTNAFMLRIILIIISFCFIFGFVSMRVIRKTIGVPLGLLTSVSDKIAMGDTSAAPSIDRHDEVGLLAESFRRMVDSIQKQVDILQKLAEGDLTMQITPRGPNDIMSMALMQTTDNLNMMFAEIKMSTSQVSVAASQIAGTAQSLASGSAQQTATVQEFSSIIGNLHTQSEQNANQAAAAYADTQKAGELMRQGMNLMQQMKDSMADIIESSNAISKVIKVIDDIAFQTNILALNAAVEAARAGQHGKGFAVVADEVRNLANKSAEAARETAELIESSIRKVAEGDAMIRKTGESLSAVAEIADSNASAMDAINGASRQQSISVSEIADGMQQISSVVQQNAATAEESAAAAEELSSQSQILEATVTRFRLKQ